MSTYAFRFKFHTSDMGQLTGDNKEFVFTLPNGHEAIMSAWGAERIGKAKRFTICSGGYNTYDDAIDYAKIIQDSFLWFGARNKIGVDVGNNKATS